MTMINSGNDDNDDDNVHPSNWCSSRSTLARSDTTPGTAPGQHLPEVIPAQVEHSNVTESILGLADHRLVSPSNYCSYTSIAPRSDTTPGIATGQHLPEVIPPQVERDSNLGLADHRPVSPSNCCSYRSIAPRSDTTPGRARQHPRPR
ncbi:hypothetical protein ElyMa_005292400 [Elysia marginata]|uniref:Uncharacterized protein n=1 Tax=Elysia marginata TaxID=1093978 RepID=A0AAV4K036_9GAST|nr:hypothetical protein ElyMa_005292400 [Elysia marginata]